MQPANEAEVRLEPMRPEHWTAVRDIYEEGIATGNATFEKTAPEWEEWDRKHLAACRIVALADGAVAGWAALSPVSTRAVYSGVAEVSVYVAARARGRGVGRALIAALVEQSEAAGVWTLQAGIFPENTASLSLHRRAGRDARAAWLDGRPLARRGADGTPPLIDQRHLSGEGV